VPRLAMLRAPNSEQMGHATVVHDWPPDPGAV